MYQTVLQTKGTALKKTKKKVFSALMELTTEWRRQTTVKQMNILQIFISVRARLYVTENNWVVTLNLVLGKTPLNI